MSFPTYPAYKDSGVDWLGEVPLGWRVGNLKHALVELVSGGTPESNNSAYWSDGDGIPWVAISDMTRGSIVDSTAKSLTEAGLKSKGLRVIPAGGLLYSIYASIGKVAVLGLNAATNQAILGLMLDSQVAEQSFIKWWLVSLEGWVKTMASSNTQDNLNAEKVRNLPLVFPSLLEQAQVAHFLDHQTARIDALIEEQQRLIELLKEKRQAAISQAVTKGLDPTVPMKDSGVEWLGEVPAHWVRKRLKNISPFITVGIVVNPSDYVADEGLPFLYGGEVKEGFIEVDKARRITPEHSRKNRKTMLEAGDIVTMRVGYPGLTAVVPPECAGGNCASVMLVKRGSYDSHWLCAVMNSRLVRQQVEVVQYGAAQKQFNISDAIEFWMFEPPIEEQTMIAEFISEQSSVLNTLMDESERSILLLNERRSALISAAVTGKIDVRDWQPPASIQAPESAVAEAV